MISYWKTQWFSVCFGFVNIGFSIYNAVQGNEFMSLCWCVSALLWFADSRINYNDERIKVLEKRVKELEAHVRERDECSCGGDRTKCDFYPEVSEKALPKFGEWISVKDRLPNQHLDDEGIELDFIVWCKAYPRSQTAYFDGKNFYFRRYDRSELIINGVTHWMSLPLPPTK